MLYKHALGQPFVSQPLTGFALTTAILANTCISLVKRMAAFALRLSGHSSNLAISIPDILSMCHGYDVAFANTVFNFTKMAMLHAVRRWPVSKDVGVNGFGITGRSPFASPKVPIALGVERTNPQPAVAEFGMQRREWAILIDMLPKAPLRWSRDIMTRGWSVFADGVASEEALRLSFDHSCMGTCPSGDFGWLSTPAFTKTWGEVKLKLHNDFLSLCHALGRVTASREPFYVTSL